MYLSVLWMSISYFCGLRVNFFASMGEMYDYEELFVIRMFDLCVDMIIDSGYLWKQTLDVWR